MGTALIIILAAILFGILADVTTERCPRCQSAVIEYMEYGEACSNPGCTWGWEGREPEWRWKVEEFPTDAHFGPPTLEHRTREPVPSEPERAPRIPSKRDALKQYVEDGRTGRRRPDRGTYA